VLLLSFLVPVHAINALLKFLQWDLYWSFAIVCEQVYCNDIQFSVFCQFYCSLILWVKGSLGNNIVDWCTAIRISLFLIIFGWGLWISSRCTKWIHVRTHAQAHPEQDAYSFKTIAVVNHSYKRLGEYAGLVQNRAISWDLHTLLGCNSLCFFVCSCACVCV